MVKFHFCSTESFAMSKRVETCPFQYEYVDGVQCLLLIGDGKPTLLH